MTEPWESLFSRAMTLLDYMEKQSAADVFWTMGGGTVLMFRHHHRSSKDIDIFFSDPQPLGFVNPRLGGAAEEMTSRYEESSGHVKLYFPEGELDFVASPLLTTPGFEWSTVLGCNIRLETDVEIVAKKMWHRGQEAKARDLFDLCLVIERSPDALRTAGECIVRHRDAFIEMIAARREILEGQFNDIESLDFRPSFDACVEMATRFLRDLDG